MKRTLSIILSMVLLISMLSVGVYAYSPLEVELDSSVYSINNGEDAYFSVTAYGGTGSYSYQWYRISAKQYNPNVPYTDQGVPIENGDFYWNCQLSELTVYSTWAAFGDPDCNYDGDLYYCEVSCSDQTVYSELARYEVLDHRIEFNDETHWALCECDDMLGFDGRHINNGKGVCTVCGAYYLPSFTITQQPADVSVLSGTNATMTVRTNKTGLTYQWCYMWEEGATPTLDGSDAIEDGDYWAGTNTNTLTIKTTNNFDYGENDLMYDGERYYCLISDGNGTVISRVATYNVYPFKDVKDRSAWYYEGVKEAAQYGLFSGDTQGRFNPTNSITRAESVVVLTRMLGFEGIDELSTQEFNEVLKELSRRLGTPLVSFKDVKASDWYGREALILAQMGFVSGVGGGNFGGSRLITRQEIAALIYRISMFIEENEGNELNFSSPSISRYTDMNKVASWAKNSVEWARATGLFSGDDKGRFNPSNNCTRAEFALVAVRFHEAY
jgi:hypothetical protein